MLQVCRQTHQEAALLPYQTNNFVFADGCSLSTFVGSLVLAQANAIETITFNDTSVSFTRTSERLLQRKLKGLKRLIAFVRVDIWLYDSNDSTGHAGRVLRSLSSLSKGSVMLAPVTLSYDPPGPHAIPLTRNPLSNTFLREWTKALETELMRGAQQES